MTVKVTKKNNWVQEHIALCASLIGVSHTYYNWQVNSKTGLCCSACLFSNQKTFAEEIPQKLPQKLSEPV